MVAAATMALVIGVAGPATSQPAEANPCATLKPTVRGASGDEILRGTSRDDVIFARDGEDTVKGFGGDDVICGGLGHDALFGGRGDDRIYGAGGSDRLIGGSGRDRTHGGAGTDSCRGGESVTACSFEAPEPAAGAPTLTVRNLVGVAGNPPAVSVTNSGKTPAFQVTLLIAFNGSVTAAQDCSIASSRYVLCDLGNLEPGASVARTFSCTGQFESEAGSAGVKFQGAPKPQSCSSG
jgi:hypothetical protein